MEIFSRKSKTARRKKREKFFFEIFVYLETRNDLLCAEKNPFRKNYKNGEDRALEKWPK
jgi:hypothetical protein